MFQVGQYVLMQGDVTASQPPVVLPDDLSERVLGFPETHMGVQMITVTLRDGRVLTGVHVAWGREVVRVDGEYGIPFTGEEVIAVEDASGLT